jgi:hypothetical protein
VDITNLLSWTGLILKVADRTTCDCTCVVVVTATFFSSKLLLFRLVDLVRALTHVPVDDLTAVAVQLSVALLRGEETEFSPAPSAPSRAACEGSVLTQAGLLEEIVQFPLEFVLANHNGEHGRVWPHDTRLVRRRRLARPCCGREESRARARS